MSDDKTKLKQDSKLISIEDPDEVRYWCRRFRCTKNELAYAVYSCGNSSRLVRGFIREMRKLP